MYVVMFQGGKVELHIIALTESAAKADQMASQYVHMVDEQCSLVIVDAKPESDRGRDYTNCVDYDLKEDGCIHRYCYSPEFIYPSIQMDQKYRSIINERCC